MSRSLVLFIYFIELRTSRKGQNQSIMTPSWTWYKPIYLKILDVVRIVHILWMLFMCYLRSLTYLYCIEASVLIIIWANTWKIGTNRKVVVMFMSPNFFLVRTPVLIIAMYAHSLLGKLLLNLTINILPLKRFYTLIVYVLFIQKSKKYDQEIPQSHSAEKPTAPQGGATEHLQPQGTGKTKQSSQHSFLYVILSPVWPSSSHQNET